MTENQEAALQALFWAANLTGDQKADILELFTPASVPPVTPTAVEETTPTRKRWTGLDSEEDVTGVAYGYSAFDIGGTGAEQSFKGLAVGITGVDIGVKGAVVDVIIAGYTTGVHKMEQQGLAVH